MALLRGRLAKGYVSIIVIGAAAVLLLVSMFAPAVSSSEDFAIYNTGWNGTSGLAVSTFELGKFSPSFELANTGTSMEVVQMGLEELDLEPVDSALAIIGPSVVFTAAEGELVGEFVRNGGILLLADDFGTGNTLLEGMGAKSRLSGKLAMDLAFNKKPEFSVCFDLRSDQLTKNISALLLNYPSSIDIDAATTKPIAYTSVASWLDLNNDMLQEFGEPRGPFVLMARESLGAGSIVLLSDPSLLINGMQEYLNNSALSDNIVSEICTGRTSVFFDESHRNYFDPISITMEFTNSVSPNAKAGVVLLTFVLVLWITTDYVDRVVSLAIRRVIVAYTWILKHIFRSSRKPTETHALSPEEIEEQLSERHPDWRPGLIRYMLKENERHSSAVREKLAEGPRQG
ncbi:MAG: hypothetical protein A3K60_03550 [Euryarchaeota archaeon RBG_19FT_COMBO_56_21]|nr:MAG: hypothetical protein A3K60_03550 [Euryarchaeota archaeon RBG_19FT_COMBO_56_21]